MDIPQNLPLTLKYAAERFPRKAGMFYKQDGRYVSASWKEISERTDRFSQGLEYKGLKAGETLAILSENRPEWVQIDMATMAVGAISVPLYNSLSSIEIQYILADAGCAVIAVSNKALLEKIVPIQKNLPNLRFIVIFDASLSLMQSEFSVPLVTLKELEKLPGDNHRTLEQIKKIASDKTATIIYTSGTTGPPKGVCLSHRNFLQNVVWSQEGLNVRSSDKHLSFLPLCHVFERMAGYYLMVHVGGAIAYAENMDTVPQNMVEVEPTYLLGVPRFYEKIMMRVLESVEKASPSRRGLFHWAKSVGEKKRLAVQAGKNAGLLFPLEFALASALVFSKFKKRLGGSVRFCVSGGAPLPREVAEFFYDMGVLILEGYGLTETSPVMTVNREEKWKFGTVGVRYPGVEIKITEEGEIITKSDCVMQGYWHKKEETERCLKEGWFYTGDLGMIDKDGFLTITGRKKELIVTSGGKKVVPRAVEEAVEKDPHILRCVLFGEGKNYLTALIVPDKDKIMAYAAEQKIAADSYAELLKKEVIYRLLESSVETALKDFAPYERIKAFVLLENDFTQSSGELTPTLKVKREVVLSRHKESLLALYEKPRV